MWYRVAIEIQNFDNVAVFASSPEEAARMVDEAITYGDYVPRDDAYPNYFCRAYEVADDEREWLYHFNDEEEYENQRS